jgi:SAM-dependent methyltransferase
MTTPLATEPGLDTLLTSLTEGDAERALDDLCRHLNHVRAADDPERWRATAVACRQHPVFPLLLEDPYTRRALEKPRGYAGDAVMLDFIYHGPPAGLSDVGHRLCRATTRSPNALSVIWRRDLIAREIEALTRCVARARILAVACGHLRELDVLDGACLERIDELVAFDQDAASIEQVRRDDRSPRVRPVVGSVSQIIRDALELGYFDLIYAAGLYDYLNDRTAVALSRALVRLLRPGGRLLVGNFVPDNHGRGYMEAVMDWQLTCRDKREMMELADTLDVADQEVFSDPWRNVTYVRATV